MKNSACSFVFWITIAVLLGFVSSFDKAKKLHEEILRKSGYNKVIFTSAKEVMFLPEFVCLFVCQKDNSKSYGRIFLKFCGYVGHGISYK